MTYLIADVLFEIFKDIFEDNSEEKDSGPIKLYPCLFVCWEWCCIATHLIWAYPFILGECSLIGTYLQCLDEKEKQTLSDVGIQVPYGRPTFQYAAFLRCIDFEKVSTLSAKFLRTTNRGKKRSLLEGESRAVLRGLFRLFATQSLNLHHAIIRENFVRQDLCNILFEPGVSSIGTRITKAKVSIGLIQRKFLLQLGEKWNNIVS